MFLTKRQLKKIIKENLLKESSVALSTLGASLFVGWLFGKTYQLASVNKQSMASYQDLALMLNQETFIKKNIEMFDTLMQYSIKCNDTNLQNELQIFLNNSEILKGLLPLAYDGSDAVSSSIDILGNLSTASLTPNNAIILAKNVGKNLPKAAKMTGILAILGAIFDVTMTELDLKEIREKINVNKMYDDLQGFDNIYNQILTGKISCEGWNL